MARHPRISAAPTATPRSSSGRRKGRAGASQDPADRGASPSTPGTATDRRHRQSIPNGPARQRRRYPAMRGPPRARSARNPPPHGGPPHRAGSHLHRRPLRPTGSNDGQRTARRRKPFSSRAASSMRPRGAVTRPVSTSPAPIGKHADPEVGLRPHGSSAGAKRCQQDLAARDAPRGGRSQPASVVQANGGARSGRPTRRSRPHLGSRSDEALTRKKHRPATVASTQVSFGVAHYRRRHRRVDGNDPPVRREPTGRRRDRAASPYRVVARLSAGQDLSPPTRTRGGRRSGRCAGRGWPRSRCSGRRKWSGS